jgi:hypothetical protein
MYTKLDDVKMAQKILDYIQKNPSATRSDIRRYCFTNMRRLRQLEAEGYLNIPAPMPRGIRNREYYANKAVQSESA